MMLEETWWNMPCGSMGFPKKEDRQHHNRVAHLQLWGLWAGFTITLLQEPHHMTRLCQDSLLHGVFSQAKVSESGQDEAPVLLPARAVG